MSFYYLFIWLCWVFVAVHGLSLVAAIGLLIAVASLCCGAQALGTQAAVVVVHRLSSSVACGIFQDQGSNRCCLHWQADS